MKTKPFVYQERDSLSSIGPDVPKCASSDVRYTVVIITESQLRPFLSVSAHKPARLSFGGLTPVTQREVGGGSESQHCLHGQLSIISENIFSLKISGVISYG